MNKSRLIRLLIPGLGLALSAPTGAAEIIGKVNLAGESQMVIATTRIGIALFPLEGQRLPTRESRDFTIAVNNLRLTPNYIVANPGDSVRFINHDKDYFKLFSPSENQSFDILLEPVGRANQASIELSRVNAMHVFCRIHAGTYGRIDVVGTPYTRMVASGESFEFRGLQPGRWKLRASAPGAETRELEVQAMTAPPPIKLNLQSLVLAQSIAGELHEPVVIDQLFPAQPGF